MSSIAGRAGVSTYVLLAVIAANAALAAVEWLRPHAGASSVSSTARPLLTTGSLSASPVIQGPAIDEPMAGSVAGPVEQVAPVEQVSMRSRAPVCRAWGPFSELEEAEAVAARLALPSREFEVFQAEIEAEPDYLVTVRASGSREAVQRILRELKSQNIDSYVLERDPSSHVLAVGVFSRPGGAERRQRQLSGLGYEADIEPLQRSHRIFHLLARVPADAESTLAIAPAGGCGDIAPMQRFL